MNMTTANMVLIIPALNKLFITLLLISYGIIATPLSRSLMRTAEFEPRQIHHGDTYGPIIHVASVTSLLGTSPVITNSTASHVLTHIPICSVITPFNARSLPRGTTSPLNNLARPRQVRTYCPHTPSAPNLATSSHNTTRPPPKPNITVSKLQYHASLPPQTQHASFRNDMAPPARTTSTGPKTRLTKSKPVSLATAAKPSSAAASQSQAGKHTPDVEMEHADGHPKTTHTQTSDTPLLSQAATNTDINDIINEINNSRLLTGNNTTDQPQEQSPSNSPAKKKAKAAETTDNAQGHEGNTNPQKRRSKKRSSSSMNPTSALKPGKYSGTSPPPDAAPKPPPHKHRHKNVLVEISIDFGKDELSQFDGDNGKKMVFAMQQLLVNLKIGDKYAVLNPADDDSDDHPLGGVTAYPVPTNMTALSNYIKGLNPRAFQSSNKSSTEFPEHGSTSTRRHSPQAYGVISLSCDKDPVLLTNQISYEWARFGNHLKIKELQALETSTPFAIYFVYALTHRQTLIDEQRDIFKMAQAQMHKEDYFLNRDLPMRWGYCPLPLCSLRMNVPRIPKHSEPTNMSRLPSNIQTCRKVLHLEVDKTDLELVNHLVSYAKSNGIYKKWWGPHAHPTEGVDWQSTPGDIRRTAKFAVKTTNYNASMTSIDVFGFLDINDTIDIKKPDGTVIRTLSGRECLTSLFKFQDATSLIAEAHQQVPLGSVSLVYPNIPEGEKLITGLAKQVAAFTLGHLSNQQVDKEFVQDFLTLFVDPQLIHEADHCEWDSETQTLLTKAELDENHNTGELEAQGWWRDVVVPYENTKGQGKRPFASPQALFDLDGAQSIKTMHEANSNASADPLQESSKRMRILSTQKDKEHSATDSADSSVVSDEDRVGKRLGDTPQSVGVRVEEDSQDMDYSSNGSASDASTASAADPAGVPPGKPDNRRQFAPLLIYGSEGLLCRKEIVEILQRQEVSTPGWHVKGNKAVC